MTSFVLQTCTLRLESCIALCASHPKVQGRLANTAILAHIANLWLVCRLHLSCIIHVACNAASEPDVLDFFVLFTARLSLFLWLKCQRLHGFCGQVSVANLGCLQAKTLRCAGVVVSGNVVQDTAMGLPGIRTQNNLGPTNGLQVIGNSFLNNGGVAIQLYCNNGCAVDATVEGNTYSGNADTGNRCNGQVEDDANGSTGNTIIC